MQENVFKARTSSLVNRAEVSHLSHKDHQGSTVSFCPSVCLFTSSPHFLPPSYLSQPSFYQQQKQKSKKNQIFKSACVVKINEVKSFDLINNFCNFHALK